MKKGGQNECIGPDPWFLPRTGHILEEMYTGGYSAVVDLSKYFHNFPTHKDDRPYLGLIHPITGVLYSYFGLQMGSANSPATSGRAGNSFMRSIRERFSLFTGLGPQIVTGLALTDLAMIQNWDMALFYAARMGLQ